MSKDTTRRISAFVSYSHRDSRQEAELRKHLATLEWQGHLRLWSDARIAAGDEWSRRISDGLEHAQLVLILLSPDYLASEACRRELTRSLELRASRGARLVPIVLGVCDWQSTALGSIQAAWGASTDPSLADLPPSAERNRAFQTIVDRLKPALRDLGAAVSVEGFDLDLAPFDIEAHHRYLALQHGRWAGDYAQLDVEPLLAQLGSKYKPTGAPPLPVSDVTGRHPRLVLLGGPGTGKTTTLLYLAQAHSRDAAGVDGSPAPLCVYVQLSRFRRAESATLLESVYDLIAEALHNSGATRERVLPGAVGRMLERRQAILLLDALNEVADDRRADCVRGVSDLLKRHAQTRVVMTSRPHGFNAQDLLEGWAFFALTELSDQSIADFIERRLGRTAFAAKLLGGLSGHRSLLRVPLFLRMVLELTPVDPERALRRLGDRSGLVKDYADYLLGWNQTAPVGLAEPETRAALMRAARALQSSGQHVREGELRDHIEGVQLEELLRRGVLVREEGYVRFFHQVMQEHFCAAAWFDDWRRHRTTIPDVPRVLRRSLTTPAMSEVASHAIAIADDDEAQVLFDVVGARAQDLTLRWLDDVCAESPPRIDIASVLRSLQRLLDRGLRFSRIPGVGREHGAQVERIVKSLLAVYLAALAAQATYSALQEGPVLRIGETPAMVLGLTAGILLGALMWRTFVPSGRAEALLVAIREIRSEALRQQLSVLVARAAASRLASPSLRGLAASLLDMGDRSAPAEILSNSVAPYAAIRLLAYDSSRLAFHLLVALLRHDNCYGLAAMRALDVRARRIPGDQAEIRAVVRRHLAEAAPSWPIFMEARRVLSERRWFGIAASGSSLDFWVWLWRRLLKPPHRWAGAAWQLLAVALGASVTGLLLTVFLWWQFEVDPTVPAAPLWFATNVVIAAPLLRDAKQIGAGSLEGGDGLDQLGPRSWATLTVIYGVFALVLYCWQRAWILRSIEPDWKEIEVTAREAAEREAGAGRV